MASFTYFDGKNKQGISMGGSARRVQDRKSKVMTLRKEREEREANRKRHNAAVTLQGWARGNSERKRLQERLANIMSASMMSSDVFNIFPLLTNKAKQDAWPRLCTYLTDYSEAFYGHTADKDTYSYHCNILSTCALKFGNTGAVLKVVLNPNPFEKFSNIAAHDKLLQSVISNGVFDHIAETPEALSSIMILSDGSLAEGAFKEYVRVFFSRGISTLGKSSQRYSATQLLLGIENPPGSLRAMQVFDMLREVVLEDHTLSAGVLSRLCHLLPEIVSEAPTVPLLHLIAELLATVEYDWFRKQMYSSLFLKSSFNRNIFSMDPKVFFGCLKSEVFDHESMISVESQSISTKFESPPEICKLLNLFCRAACYYLDCSDIRDFANMVPVADITRKVVNICARMLHSDFRPSRSRVKFQDSVVTLVRKLHDWNAREQFLEPAGWIIKPLYPWPSSVNLSNWLSDTSSPIFQILQKIPFIIPFDARVLMFRSFIDQDMSQLDPANWWGDNASVIRREHIFEDGYSAISKMTPEQLKMKSRVVFESLGAEEAGFGDGVFKEFLNILSKVAFDPNWGLFLQTEAHEVYPSPSAQCVYGDFKERLRFLGRVLGKALYEGILIDLPLSRFFRNSLLSRSNHFHDLSSLDPELYSNLVKLSEMSGPEVEDLGLTFATTIDIFGEAKTIEFFPGGSETPVTDDNKMRYIYMVSHYKLTNQISSHVAAFRDGMQEVISPTWLNMFDSSELQILLGGYAGDQSLDIDDWEAHTTYGGGYSPSHQTIKLFWQVVKEQLTPEQQRRLLKFATSVDRAPLLGFKYFNPKFCIHMSDADTQRLPSSSTCMSLLKLPPYANRAQMRDRLTVAVQHDTGFSLS
eukprot:TRINITY_DN2662_c0_g1_i1.p1 TRINITY_DN2662_c0_g1~~TRINITY_DN2662_c0_g1_i1.p1  ORF type:complete len:880 (+),score=139.01 TRINITY_DN2662_c0_g1_i1:47-2641(+)